MNQSDDSALSEQLAQAQENIEKRHEHDIMICVVFGLVGYLGFGMLGSGFEIKRLCWWFALPYGIFLLTRKIEEYTVHKEITAEVLRKRSGKPPVEPFNHEETTNRD